MKTITRLLLIGIITHCFMHAQADARGELPPPPPFMGGSAGDWLGSGPIFGFEEPSLGGPWNGGGYGGMGGGSNGGWGGAWWNGEGPLGGGGWGGWGGWGSGLGPGAGGTPTGSDTTKKGYLWPDVGPVYSSCWKKTETGGYSDCACLIFINPENPPAIGSVVSGVCRRGGGPESDPYRSCPGVDAPCSGDYYP